MNVFFKRLSIISFQGFKKRVEDLSLNYNNKRKTSQLIEVLVMY